MKTANDARQEWINSLKVGDEVFVRNTFNARICKVTKITPTRRMEVDQFRVKFSNDGYEMGSSWSPLVMFEVTDEIRESLKRNESVNVIRDFKWETLTTQQLLDVLKIISETK